MGRILAGTLALAVSIGLCIEAACARHAVSGEAPSFDQLDRDGDGVLRRGECLPFAELLSHWALADRDSNGVVDRSEFARFRDRRARLLPERVPVVPHHFRVHTEAI